MTTYVNNTYGNSSSDYYSPWPVLMPVDGATAWDATTGEESEVPLSTYYIVRKKKRTEKKRT